MNGVDVQTRRPTPEESQAVFARLADDPRWRAIWRELLRPRPDERKEDADEAMETAE